MTALLRLNGITVPAANGEANFTPESQGVMERASNLEMRDARRGQKGRGNFTLTPRSATESEAWQGIINGRGVHWGFDDGLASDWGVNPNTGYGATRLVSTGPTPKFGAGCLEVPSAGSIGWTFNLFSPDVRWSLLFWRWTGAAWNHYVILSDGTQYENGAADSGIACYSVSTSSPETNVMGVTMSLLGKTLDGVSNALSNYDDVVFLPFMLNNVMIASLYTNAESWGRTPRMNMRGGAVVETTREVVGRVSQTGFLQASVDGATFANNNRVVGFELVEA